MALGTMGQADVLGRASGQAEGVLGLRGGHHLPGSRLQNLNLAGAPERICSLRLSSEGHDFVESNGNLIVS